MKLLCDLAEMTEDQARDHLETVRWPNGPMCPRCGETKRIYRLKGKSTRAGLLKCGGCRKPFSVTVGTIMEASHISLKKWLVAFHLIASSKKGISSHQLHRTLGITLKAAWFLSHRIRHAMGEDPLKTVHEKLKGTVEIDECYVGGRPRPRSYQARKGDPKPKGWHPPYREKRKTPVVALVERDGRLRALAMERVPAAQLRPLIREMVDVTARIMTDESTVYHGLQRIFTDHQTVKHSLREYARGEAHINTAESFFSLIKRQHMGAHHHYSKKHLPKYVDEAAFRWNTRKLSDSDRRDVALAAAEGKRLTYREPTRNQ